MFRYALEGSSRIIYIEPFRHRACRFPFLLGRHNHARCQIDEARIAEPFFRAEAHGTVNTDKDWDLGIPPQIQKSLKNLLIAWIRITAGVRRKVDVQADRSGVRRGIRKILDDLR